MRARRSERSRFHFDLLGDELCHVLPGRDVTRDGGEIIRIRFGDTIPSPSATNVE